MTEKGNKRRKLPDRYPREQATIIFGDIYELDHVLEGLTNLGKYLGSLPDDMVTVTEWESHATDPLIYLIDQLRKAYIEYERFWQPSDWAPECDREFMECLEDHHELHWRLGEIEAGCFLREKNGKVFRAYDPALESCAKALYQALALRQIPCGKEDVDYGINSLKYQLTRYHATSLEVLLGRNAVFTSGRQKGAVSTLHKYLKKLYSMQHPEVNFETFWAVIGAECHTKTVNGYFSLKLEEVDEDMLYYIEGNEQKDIKKSTIRNKLSSYKK